MNVKSEYTLPTIIFQGGSLKDVVFQAKYNGYNILPPFITWRGDASSGLQFIFNPDSNTDRGTYQIDVELSDNIS